MRIEWEISKKRGNLRPKLTYTISLEDHEKALAMPPLAIRSDIPKPPEAWREYCYPKQDEREEKFTVTEYYTLNVPPHKLRTQESHSLRLPWRANNEYPEVERSFTHLRDVYEQALQITYNSLPIQEQKSLETSDTAKQYIAPAMLAERFLHFARGTAI